jgi:hypothetical protein
MVIISMMLPHRNIHKHTSTSADTKRTITSIKDCKNVFMGKFPTKSIIHYTVQLLLKTRSVITPNDIQCLVRQWNL